ncbi:MAG: hypothetical protein J2P43_01520 [Candidatus Dormibacteraeota bacterium]|nr:hypothetical protein [Candidatus Dormibacteraeota bacterium]
MSELYAPNQQVVRADGSGPAEEGNGGEAVTPEPAPAVVDDGLDAMTKDQLIAEASERGVDVNAAMTKDEIKAAIRGA